VYYSKEGARGRFLLQRTLEVLTICAIEDAHASQDLAFLARVDESASAKTWKGCSVDTALKALWRHFGRFSRLLSLWKKMQHEKDERKTRPKPAPGGGAALNPIESIVGLAPWQPLPCICARNKKRKINANNIARKVIARKIIIRKMEERKISNGKSACLDVGVETSEELNHSIGEYH
jgi:hypothetical protein